MGSCNNNGTATTPPVVADSAEIADTPTAAYDTTFKVEAESFADLQLLRYQVPGFSKLPLPEKQLAYYLSEAALRGREIIYDQTSNYGLMLRKTLATVYGSQTGESTRSDCKKIRQ